MISSIAVDTAWVPRHERFSLWREALAATHEVELPDGSDPHAFNAYARGWHVGNALVLESRSTPQILRRLQRMIRADQTDHYIIRLQRKGRWLGQAADRSVETGPGGVMILDMARASEARTGGIDNINVMLPRDMLDDILPPFEMHGLVLHDALGALLRSHLESLADNLSRMQRADAARVADATCHLVAACLAPSQDAIARARAPLAAARLREVRRYIDRHLHAPHLSPQDICTALRMSRSTLYDVCEPMGGVAAFIRKRRLQRVHAILTGLQERRLISEVAYRHGFVSNAHFSRAFRNAFGYSPREAREAGAVPMPVEDPDFNAGTSVTLWTGSVVVDGTTFTRANCQ
jgi:AraC-like DNA-binding protein